MTTTTCVYNGASACIQKSTASCGDFTGDSAFCGNALPNNQCY